VRARISTLILVLAVVFMFDCEVFACGGGGGPPSPVAVLSAEPDHVIVNVDTILDGNDSYTTWGYINKYEWDFTSNGTYDYNETSSNHSDGAFDGNTPHHYSDPGAYTVTLRVSNSFGGTSADTCKVYVRPQSNTIYVPDDVSTIQEAIDIAVDGNTVVVSAGTYELAYFKGKKITVRSTDPDDWDVVEDTIIHLDQGVPVLFNSGEDENTVLTGFTVTGNPYGISSMDTPGPKITRCIVKDNPVYGIYCAGGSAPQITNNIISGNGEAGIYSFSSSPPTVKNNLIYDNDNGIKLGVANSAAVICNNTIVDNISRGIWLVSGTAPEISNCIIWNCNDDLAGCNATYSCIQDGNTGTGNISNDPLFANAAGNDFHLKSSAGRWNGTGWVNDSVLSPCINNGDPASEYSNEPSPNGSRINMGAYGNTSKASKYAANRFNLTVNLTTDDEAALPSNAKWYLGSDSTQRNSGETVVLDAGNYNITIKCTTPASGDHYIKPNDKTININGLSEKTETMTYKAAGYIIYVCYYYDAYGDYIDSNDKVGWKVSGEGSYHNGQRKYAKGTYTVQFKSVAEHATPTNTQITVTKGSSNSPYDKQYQRTTFYVDIDYGSDSDKGGSFNPYLTIQKGFNMVPSGGWIYVKSNYSTIYEGITFPSSNRDCYIQSQSGNITVRGDHTPDSCPYWINRIGVTFQEW